MNISIKTPTEQEQQEAHANFINWLRNNPNNFSYWFPKLSVVRQHGVLVPKSRIINVPEELLEAFFLERKGDKRLIRQWAHDNILPVIKSHFQDTEVFMKNGCFSGKFNFNACCHLPANATLKEIVQHLCNIQYDSLANDTAGNLEVILREWVKPMNGTETIYGGMPLRAEMRLFYDFDSHQPLYYVNYWDWDYCHEAICCQPEDKTVYENYYPFINEEVELYAKDHWQTICDALSHVSDMKGDWSIDFILESNRVWMIDAAIGRQSAYWDEKKITAARNK